jgi:hypothetical protein
LARKLTNISYIVIITLFVVVAIDAAAADKPEFRTVPQYIFGVGETMKYSINYGVVSAGTATIRIKDYVMAGDRPCFRLQTEARSRKFFDVFFKVRDFGESWLDVQGLFTWRFEKHLNEGSYHDNKVVTYNYQAGHATVTDEGSPTDTTELLQEVQDGLSCLYWARLFPLKPDTVLTIPTLDVNKVYSVKVHVLGIDTVDTPAGNFRCFKVEPTLEGEGIFKKDPSGRIWLWFTDDAFRIPVMMQTKVIFGHITARLTDFTPGRTVPSDMSAIREQVKKQSHKKTKVAEKPTPHDVDER